MLTVEKKRPIPDEYVPWVTLAAEIIKRVAKEYKKALKKDNKEKIKYYERWFRSEYFTILSLNELDPETVIKRIKESENVGFAGKKY